MTALSDSFSWLVRGADALAIPLTEAQLNQFDSYRALLLDWNKRLNLTAITEDKDIQVRHFLDSISCSLVTGDLNESSLIDVGAGGGFPGVPLKILFPTLKLTLVDSVTKKTAFLQALIEELGLSNVQVMDERIEVIGQDPDYRESFDWAAARAVAEMSTLVEYLLPLCRIGGHALAQKGVGAADELDAAAGAITLLGGGAQSLTPVALLDSSALHYLVKIQKIGPTPEKYPRRPGIPSKRPLI